MFHVFKVKLLRLHACMPKSNQAIIEVLTLIPFALLCFSCLNFSFFEYTFHIHVSHGFHLQFSGSSVAYVDGSFCEFIVQGDRFLPTKNSNGILEITVAAICFN